MFSVISSLSEGMNNFSAFAHKEHDNDDNLNAAARNKDKEVEDESRDEPDEHPLLSRKLQQFVRLLRDNINSNLDDENKPIVEPCCSSIMGLSSTKRQIHFNETVTVYESLEQPCTRKEKRNTWYRRKDFYEFRENAKQVVQKIRDDARKTGKKCSISQLLREHECFRGLENTITKQSKLEALKRRAVVLQSVLQEQTAQNYCKCPDPKRIRMKSKAHSKQSKQFAKKLAHHDAAYVQKHVLGIRNPDKSSEEDTISCINFSKFRNRPNEEKTKKKAPRKSSSSSNNSKPLPVSNSPASRSGLRSRSKSRNIKEQRQLSRRSTLSDDEDDDTDDLGEDDNDNEIESKDILIRLILEQLSTSGLEEPIILERADSMQLMKQHDHNNHHPVRRITSYETESSIGSGSLPPNYLL